MKSNKFYLISILTYSAIIIIFLTQVLIVRLLDVTDYGVYALLVAVISIIEVPLIGRSGELVLKLAGEKWNNDQRKDAISIINYIIKTEKKMFWFIYFLLIVASFVLFHLFDTDSIYLAILSLTIPMQIGYGSYKSFLTITNNVHLLSIIEVCYALFTFVLIYIGLYLFSLNGLMFTLVGAAIAKTQVSKFFYKKQLIKYSIDPSFTGIYAVNQLGFRKRSFNSIFRLFIQNSILQADIIILGVLQKPELVAIYKVGKSLAGLPTKVSIPVWKFLYPSLVKAVNLRDSNLAGSTIIKGSFIVAFLFFLIYIGSWLVGEKLIQMLYGADYGESYSVFLVLLVGYGAFYAVNGWFKIWVALIDEMFIGSIYYLVTLIIVILISVMFSGNLVSLSLGITVLMVFMVFISYILGFKIKKN